MTAAPAAARYLVRGQVQGVGFRWFVRREAQWLGLHGFVRNLPDGSVEVVAAGAPDALTVLEAVLGEGPRAARVSRVEKSDVPHEQTIPNDFQIM